MLHRRLSALLVLAAVIAGCCQQAAPPVAMPGRVSVPVAVSSVSTIPFINVHALIIVRHDDIDPAQKASMGNLAPLTPRGVARSEELLAALRDAHVNRIITSVALRTQQSAAPLAAALHITPEDPFGHGAEMPAVPRNPSARSSPAAGEAATVIGYLAQTAKPTDTVLVVHHHSIIPSLLAQLGFPDEPAFDDATEFDRVYLLLPDPATHTYQLFRLRYGVSR